MATGLIGKKVGMTRVFTDAGEQVPVTVVHVGPCIVVGKRTIETDSYTALRLGYGERKERHTNKPRAGEAKKAGVKAPILTREFRLSADELAKFEIGQELKADLFEKDQWIDVTGVSKGRGFAGVFKRYNFGGMIEGHGTHEFFRHGGAIGQRKSPGRVFKNRKMPGHMGAERVTVQKLKVVGVDVENNVVLVHGAVPGHINGVVVLKPSVKAKKK